MENPGYWTHLYKSGKFTVYEVNVHNILVLDLWMPHCVGTWRDPPNCKRHEYLICLQYEPLVAQYKEVVCLQWLKTSNRIPLSFTHILYCHCSVDCRGVNSSWIFWTVHPHWYIEASLVPKCCKNCLNWNYMKCHLQWWKHNTSKNWIKFCKITERQFLKRVNYDFRITFTLNNIHVFPPSTMKEWFWCVLWPSRLFYAKC